MAQTPILGSFLTRLRPIRYGYGYNFGILLYGRTAVRPFRRLNFRFYLIPHP
jgi:hypothetical protein